MVEASTCQESLFRSAEVQVNPRSRTFPWSNLVALINNSELCSSSLPSLCLHSRKIQSNNTTLEAQVSNARPCFLSVDPTVVVPTNESRLAVHRPQPLILFITTMSAPAQEPQQEVAATATPVEAPRQTIAADDNLSCQWDKCSERCPSAEALFVSIFIYIEALFCTNKRLTGCSGTHLREARGS